MSKVEVLLYLVLGGQFGPRFVRSAIIFMGFGYLYVVIELDDLPLLQLLNTWSKTQLHTDAYKADQPFGVLQLCSEFTVQTEIHMIYLLQ